MHIVRRSASLLVLAFLSACARGPSRDEALAALRLAQPALDSTTVRELVWQDGPPWFSCAEVVAKFTSVTDSSVVRNQVGNWKPLVGSGWATLKDSASGAVTDPGWCTVAATPAGQPNLARWTPVTGAPFPTGHPRRGWTMVVGHRHLVVPVFPEVVARDSATVPFLVSVAANLDGVAVGAERDTTRFMASLHRIKGIWLVAGVWPAALKR